MFAWILKNAPLGNDNASKTHKPLAELKAHQLSMLKMIQSPGRKSLKEHKALSNAYNHYTKAIAEHPETLQLKA